MWITIHCAFLRRVAETAIGSMGQTLGTACSTEPPLTHDTTVFPSACLIHRWSQNWVKWHASNADPHLTGSGLQSTDYRALIQDHPCHTPGKDLVLPAFRPPPLFHASPFLGGDSRRPRDILLLLRGDMGRCVSGVRRWRVSAGWCCSGMEPMGHGGFPAGT